jgi:hypothetical protein
MLPGPCSMPKRSYINIRWVVPEGGDGPNYSQM